MALVLYGGGIADMRGSVGGNVHSRNRYGNYIRQKTKPVNPNSSAQQIIRNIMGSVVNRWSNVLSAAQRAAWETYAAAISFTNKLGQSVKLTGANHYIRTNVVRVQEGILVLDAAPTDLTLPATDALFAISVSSATQIITVSFDDSAAWASENSARMTIQQGIPQAQSRQFFNGPFRRIGALDGSASSPLTSPQTIAVDFAVAVDQRLWAKGRILRADGRLSEFFRNDTTIIA
ncbi:hypothetical protein LCGC14_1189190 [marine sediment metagenome]|uniref:Uncharacterized protein n=1 Tax=marine sediment metagenome TaxID=412755 RepID=A0A0F9M7P6_9ZZZZ